MKNNKFNLIFVFLFSFFMISALSVSLHSAIRGTTNIGSIDGQRAQKHRVFVTKVKKVIFWAIITLIIVGAIYKFLSWKNMPVKIRELIAADKIKEAAELYEKYMKGFSGCFPEISEFSSSDLYKLYSFRNKTAELLIANFPDRYYSDFINEFIRDGDLKTAYKFYKKCNPKDLDRETVFKLHKELGILEKLAEENLSASWLIDYAGKLLELNDVQKAYVMLNAVKKFDDELCKDNEETIFETYHKSGHLNELKSVISRPKAPIDFKKYVLIRLKEENLNVELMEFLTEIPESNWKVEEYGFWLESCLSQKSYGIMMKSPSQIKQREDGNEILQLYYKKAREFEEAGNTAVAVRIYEPFVNENVAYKDILSRFIRLSGSAAVFSKKALPRGDELETRVGGDTGTMNKYETIRELGRGGMGIVYEAVNKKIGKKVALKKMKEELAINLRERNRFIEEARRVAALHHPNITDIYDIIDGAKDIYLVFEFVEGKTVEEILSTTGKFSVKETLEIIKQVCEALKYAHSKRIIHRDIKPSNIMISKSPLYPPLSKGERGGLVKVMDFGIAREAKDTFSRITGKDTSGTLAYMAPEQELGSYSEQSDIFSVGVCFYEMLTGELPFKGPNFLAQKRERHYRKIREVNSEVPDEIETIVEKCLQPEKEKRFQMAEELVEALLGIFRTS